MSRQNESSEFRYAHLIVLITVKKFCPGHTDSLISFVLFQYSLMCLPSIHICLSFCPFFCALDFSLTAHLRHSGCKWLGALGSPQDSSLLAPFPRFVLRCRQTATHSCQCLWSQGWEVCV